jgi:hypothetical protein
MSNDQQPSFGQRIYRALFKVFGPADVGPTGPPAAHNPDDRTVPAGYHLETITDDSGNRRRIAVQDQFDEDLLDQHQPDPRQTDELPQQNQSNQSRPHQSQPGPKQDGRQ